MVYPKEKATATALQKPRFRNAGFFAFSHMSKVIFPKAGKKRAYDVIIWHTVWYIQQPTWPIIWYTDLLVLEKQVWYTVFVKLLRFKPFDCICWCLLYAAEYLQTYFSWTVKKIVSYNRDLVYNRSFYALWCCEYSAKNAEENFVLLKLWSLLNSTFKYFRSPLLH